MNLFDVLGFRWQRLEMPAYVTVHPLERVLFRFHRLLSEFVWDAGVLEGNPFTFAEVKTLLEGITVGGRKLSDQEQILNLAESSKQLLSLVKTQQFKCDKKTFCALHAIVAQHEALEWGHFRGEGAEITYTPDVSLGELGRYTPIITAQGAPALNACFLAGIQALEQQIPSPFERALLFFLFGALQQFFFDGNKRTSRHMMNGILMSHGLEAISIPAAQAQVFNEKMARFYDTKAADEILAFLVGCYPS